MVRVSTSPKEKCSKFGIVRVCTLNMPISAMPNITIWFWLFLEQMNLHFLDCQDVIINELELQFLWNSTFDSIDSGMTGVELMGTRFFQKKNLF